MEYEDTDEEPTPELPEPVELVSSALAQSLLGVTPDELAEVRAPSPSRSVHLDRQPTTERLCGRCSTSRRGAACSVPPIARQALKPQAN